MDKLVERKVTTCVACQVTTLQTAREQLQMSSLPPAPWQVLDFKNLSSGKSLPVITDDYSRYPIVEVLCSTSAQTVIPRIDKVFAEFGIPDVVRSDNSPPFNGKNSRSFQKHWDSSKEKSPPYGLMPMVR